MRNKALLRAVGSGEPSLVQQQPQNQGDHNHDSDLVDRIHDATRA
jgi:hypothetical protein